MMWHPEGRHLGQAASKALGVDCLPSRATRLHENKTNTEHPTEFEFQVNWSFRYAVAFSCFVVSDSATPWTVAHQGPLSMGFSRQEYYSGLPLASPVFVWKFLCEYVPNFAWNTLILTLNTLFVVCLKFKSGHPKFHVAMLLPSTSLSLPSSW